MPKCHYCHEQLSRLDKDVCPFCGAKKPLEGVDDSTVDITKMFDPIKTGPSLKPRSRVFAAILSFFFGIFGIHEFYIARSKRGIALLIISICLIGGLGTLLFFTGLKNSVFAYLIPFFVVELYCILEGIVLLTSHTIKDGRGEFLK